MSDFANRITGNYHLPQEALGIDLVDQWGERVIPIRAMVYATWCGDGDVLPIGAEVAVLAVDPGARLSRAIGVSGVPVRTACWIRWWPEDWDCASYRSCDLADLDMSDEDFSRLIGAPK